MLYLKRNDRVRLPEPIGVIPAGCYKYLEQDGDFLIFQVGRKIVFGLANLSPGKLIKEKMTVRLNTAEEFVVEYSLRLELQKDARFDPTQPFTFCNIHPDLWGSEVQPENCH